VVIDAPPEDDAEVGGFLRGLGSILTQDGIAMCVSQYVLRLNHEGVEFAVWFWFVIGRWVL
jgi:hypothetical protein